LQKIYKEDNQLQFTDEEKEEPKVNNDAVSDKLLYSIIGLLSIIIIILFIKKKNE
jgi:hypothetical protein